METTYVVSGATSDQPITYITTGTKTQTTYITTNGPTAPPPGPPRQTVNVVVTSSKAKARQTNTALPAMFLFAYGGMDMLQGLGVNVTTFALTGSREYFYSWFIGFIIGAVVASLLVTHLPKVVFYMLSAIMELIDAIIMVSASYEYNSIVAARYVGGVGIGLLTVPFIIHGAEVTSNTNRGIVTTVEQYGTALGIAVELIYNTIWAEELDASVYLIHGVVGIVFSLLSLSLLYFATESPIFYIRRNQEQKARFCLQKLQLTQQATDRAWEEAKLYVVEGESQSLGEQLVTSAMPFIKLLFYRCFVAFTINLPLVLSMLTSTLLVELNSFQWPLIVWGLLRLIGAILTSAVIETLGRKLISLVGLLCMAALTLGIAGIYATPANMIDYYYMSQVFRMGLAFQFFAGVFVCSSAVYLSEAFQIQVKPYLIGLIVCIEQVVQIIVIACFKPTPEYFFQYFLVVGIILVIGLIAFAILMPETRGMTLRQAGERFRRLHDVTPY